MKNAIASRNGKRKHRTRSKTKKHFGELRLAKCFNEFHGFDLQPGMFFGIDEDGLFVTRANMEKIWTNNEKGERFFTLEYPVWRKSEATGNEWVRMYEPEHSPLWDKLNGLHGTALKQSAYLREHADYERIAQIRAEKKEAHKHEMELDRIPREIPKDVPKQLGMRMSNTDFIFQPLGRPPFPNQFSEAGGRTEYGTEKNRLDVCPVAGCRMQTDIENPQHPGSRGIYTR